MEVHCCQKIDDDEFWELYTFCIVTHGQFLSRGAHGIVVRSELSYPSSNPKLGCLCLTSHLYPTERYEFSSSIFKYG